jgi:2-keto-4-pentenoate hydratase/2-oxohepta-3-ene-1,7-dioic acid hydratase in catechol pathway
MKIGRLRTDPSSLVVELDGRAVSISDLTGGARAVSWDAVMTGGLPALDLIGDIVAITPDSGVGPGHSASSLGPAAYSHGKIICIGLNYRRHAEESGMPVPNTPIVFSKYHNTLTGSGDPVHLPESAYQFDYEVELGVVIGKEARFIPEAEALEAVLGYVVCNDLSARDAQFMSSQWLLGKSFDGFLPVGGWLSTADEVADPHQLAIRTWLNGELRQDSNTSDMIFNVPQIISFVSRYMTLDPGDLIITGTPEGVIMGEPEPRRWLVPGDHVRVEIEGLGTVETPLVA